MEHVHLGRTGLRVSRLCLGAGCFGYVSGKLFGNLGMTEERSFQLMDLALEHGINFFDTADAYGWDQGVGLSESIIGGWFAWGLVSVHFEHLFHGSPQKAHVSKAYACSQYVTCC